MTTVGVVILVVAFAALYRVVKGVLDTEDTIVGREDRIEEE